MREPSSVLLIVAVLAGGCSEDGEDGEGAADGTVAYADSIPVIDDEMLPALTSDVVEHTVIAGGIARQYFVHTPTGGWSGRRPVVLHLHGNLSRAEIEINFFNQNRAADRHGYIAVYANGTPARMSAVDWLYFWNIGEDRCDLPEVDDVDFAARLLDDVEARYEVDPDRVYVTGVSGGAFLTYLLACTLSERIAAIAPVAAVIPDLSSWPQDPCASPARAVPVMSFFGTKDKWNGFTKAACMANNPEEDWCLCTERKSVEASLAITLAINDCDPSVAEIESIPDRFLDGTRVHIRRYTACGPSQDATDVELVVVEGGGHSWPGVRREQVGSGVAAWIRAILLEIMDMIFGRSTLEISANEAMWEFFEQHPR